eukprot:TRINITY_DN13360_c0_g1_i4.p1 TRINITY_DN13360_c0_g1~~TRINITY_DN13360_c0_g1_i4.p1  ORF type:complete len:900 (-),score=123.90 TRINITY_DN13360_c0_g1_i4:33-2657(-)
MPKKVRSAGEGDGVKTKPKKSLIMKYKTENRVLQLTCYLLDRCVQDMQYKESVLAPHVGMLLEYIVRLLIGEEARLASDQVALDSSPQSFLKVHTFFRNLENVEGFDELDREWLKQTRHRYIVNHPQYWNYYSYSIVLPLCQEAIGVTGQGNPKFPVIQDFIQACNSTVEVYSMFGKRANGMYHELLGTVKRTSEYYAEIQRLCQNIAILTMPNYGRAAKGSALGDICAMIYGGSSGRIMAALDLHISKYLHIFIEHPEEEIRKRCFLIFFQLSKALANDDALSLLSTESAQIAVASKEKAGTMKKLRKKALPEINKDWTLLSYFYGQNSKSDPIDTKRYINFAYDIPAVHFQQNRIYLATLGKALESPVFSASLMRQIKLPTENQDSKMVILHTLINLFSSDETMIRSLNCGISDCFMTLNKLMIALGGRDKKNPEGKLPQEIKSFFEKLFELRNPLIKYYLKQAKLRSPRLATLGALLDKSERILNQDFTAEELMEQFNIPEFCKDLQAFFMYHASEVSADLLKKTYKKTIEMLAKCVNILWTPAESRRTRHREDIIHLLKNIFDVWDWLAVKGFAEILVDCSGGKMIESLLIKLTTILSQFRMAGGEDAKEYLAETLYDNKKIRTVERQHRYQCSPLLPLAIPLQHIISLLVQKDNKIINEKLESLNFGQLFGEQLQLQYEFMKITMDYETERLGLLDIYVEQSSCRLCTLEYLLKSSSAELKKQFLKSRFIEKMSSEYIIDTREFSVKYNKIDLKFLAFRYSYPIRNESISIIHEIIKNKATAYDLYTELIQRLYRNQIIAHECNIIKNHSSMPELQMQTSLLFFSVLLSIETDMVYAFKDEGVIEAMVEIMKNKPRLKFQFPLLAKYFI